MSPSPQPCQFQGVMTTSMTDIHRSMIRVSTYNAGAKEEQSCRGKKMTEFQQKLFSDVDKLMKDSGK